MRAWVVGTWERRGREGDARARRDGLVALAASEACLVVGDVLDDNPFHRIYLGLRVR